MDFIETVRTQAGLADDAQAEGVAEVVLEVLGGRFASGNVEALAVELPDRFAAALRRGSDGQAHTGGTAQLGAKVGAALTRPDAPAVDADPLDLLVAVMRGLVAVAPREVLDHLAAQLPRDLEELLQPQEQGDTSQVHANSPQPGEPGTQPGRAHATGDPTS